MEGVNRRVWTARDTKWPPSAAAQVSSSVLSLCSVQMLPLLARRALSIGGHSASCPSLARSSPPSDQFLLRVCLCPLCIYTVCEYEELEENRAHLVLGAHHHLSHVDDALVAQREQHVDLAQRRGGEALARV